MGISVYLYLVLLPCCSAEVETKYQNVRSLTVDNDDFYFNFTVVSYKLQGKLIVVTGFQKRFLQRSVKHYQIRV